MKFRQANLILVPNRLVSNPHLILSNNHKHISRNPYKNGLFCKLLLALLHKYSAIVILRVQIFRASISS